MSDRPWETCAETHRRLEAVGGRMPATLAVPDDFRRAAVLVLVGCQDDVPGLVLTERSARLRSHAGEIALAGGRIDPGETPEEAAVREAVEEIGADPLAVTVLGRLDEAWSKAGNHVVPVVAWYEGDLRTLAPASPEVTRVCVVPLAEIARPEAHEIDVVELDGVTFENDVIATAGCRIYGLTADLVLDLVAWLDGRERNRVPVRVEELARKLARGT